MMRTIRERLSFISIILAFSMFFSGVSYMPVYGATKAPGKVKSLKCVSKSATTVRLSWKKVSNASGYKVYCLNGKKWKKLATIKGAKKTKYTSKKLRPSTVYKFKVRAYRGRKMGKWSAVIKVRTRNISKQSDSKIEPEENKTVSKTVTDFMGVERTFYSDEGGRKWSWYLKDDPYHMYESPDLIIYNREINGSMKSDDFGGQTLYQQSGAFIGVDTEHCIYPEITLYCGDLSKLSFEPVEGFTVITVDTYNYDKEPIKKQYLVKDGCRIVSFAIADTQLTDHAKNYYKEKFGITGIKQKTIYTSGSDAGCGFGYQRRNVLDLAMDTAFIMKYNDDIITTIICKNNEKDAAKTRQECLDVAIAAIDSVGGKKSFYDDMRDVRQYVYVNYPYEKYTYAGGALILEAYSIYAYNEYGFFSYGSQGPGRPNYGFHVSFNLDSDPDTMFETQGHD